MLGDPFRFILYQDRLYDTEISVHGYPIAIFNLILRPQESLVHKDTEQKSELVTIKILIR